MTLKREGNFIEFDGNTLAAFFVHYMSIPLSKEENGDWVTLVMEADGYPPLFKRHPTEEAALQWVNTVLTLRRKT